MSTAIRINNRYISLKLSPHKRLIHQKGIFNNVITEETWKTAHLSSDQS